MWQVRTAGNTKCMSPSAGLCSKRASKYSADLT